MFWNFYGYIIIHYKSVTYQLSCLIHLIYVSDLILNLDKINFKGLLGYLITYSILNTLKHFGIERKIFREV